MSKSNRQWTKKGNAGPSSHKGGPSSSSSDTPTPSPATAISIATGSAASIALSAGATAAAAAAASATAASSSSVIPPPSSGKNEVSSVTSSLSSLSLSPSPSPSVSLSSNQSDSGESSISDSDKQFILRKGDLAAPLIKGGTIGSKLMIKANFFPIQLKLKQLFIYGVDFEPVIGLELAAKRKREISRFYSIIDRAFARQHSFNGHTINSMKEIVVDSLLPLVLENENTPNALFVASVSKTSFRIRLNDKTGSQISAVTIHYERTVTPDDMNSSEISHITATFVRAILTRRLQLLNLQNAYFDPKQVHQIQQYRFQLMMGYQAVVNACHQRQALIVDVVHKIYQPTTLDKLIVEKLEALKKGSSTTPALFNQLLSNKALWEEAMDEYRGRRMIYSNKISKRVVRCDFIDFEMHLDMVMDKTKDSKLTYRQYFNDKYKIKLSQQFPGLVCEFRMRPSKAWKLIEQGKKVDGTYYPLELCNPTGSLDRDRADFRMLKAIADVSRKPPNVKLDLINKFTALLSTINTNNNSGSGSSSSSSSSSPVGNKRSTIADMATENLSIEAKMMEATARILPGPRIIAGSNIFLIDGDNPKKNMQVQQGVMKQSLLNTSGKSYQLPSSKPYGIIYSLEDEKNEICKWFLEEFQKECGRMKIKLPTQSKLFGVVAGGPGVWQTKANEIVSKEAANLSFVIVILPLKNTDLIYSMLKTIFIQGGIIHSCIKADSINRTYEGKLKGAIPSYVFQLFIKQGALQWCVEPALSIQPHVPLHPALQAARFGGHPNTMIVAADVSHDAKAKTVWNPPASSSGSSLFSASVSSSFRQKVDTVGFVATYDSNFTQYHSFVGTQTSGKLGSDLIQRSDEFMKRSCELFKQKNNNKYPENIIVYRDGVGESQIASFVYQEMIKYQSAFNELKIKPKLTVIVVQKRVGARFFTNNGGTAPPGTVIDSGITSSGRREFYLVNCETPPNANAVPTRYIIVQDDNNFSMDQIELFTHHLSYGFSNWRGPIKIPAPIKCADNLSRLFGRFIRNANNNNVHHTIASTTYFL